MRLTTFLISSIAVCFLNGQSIKLLDNLSPLEQRAVVAYDRNEYEASAALFAKAYKKDTTEAILALRAANSYYRSNQYRKSEEWYRKAWDLVMNSEDDLLKFSQVLMTNNQYQEAQNLLESYKARNGNGLIAEEKLGELSDLTPYLKDSSAVIVELLTINTNHAEFSPAYYQDGIVFLSDQKQIDYTDAMGWSQQEYVTMLFTKEREGGRMSEPVEFHQDLNSLYHEGPLAFYDDNKVVYTRSGIPEKKTHEALLELHTATYDKANDQWIDQKPLPFNSDVFSVAHPAISQDGNFIVFTSNKLGGYGGNDLYLAEKVGGQWADPVNAGPVINTKGDELFPYLVDDNELIFSSNGHGGLGELDLFRAPLRAASPDEIVNMGYPFNSAYADFGFISDEEGITGYFTSNRRNGGMDDDIYEFRVKWSRVEVTVLAQDTDERIGGVKLDVLVNGNPKDSRYSDKNGVINILAMPGEELNLDFSKDGYYPKSLVVTEEDLYAGRSLPLQVQLEKTPSVYKKGPSDPKERLLELYNRKKAMIQVNGRVYEYREVGNSRFIVNADETILLSNEPPDLEESMEERAKKAVADKGMEMQEVYLVKDIYFGLNSFELTEEAKEELDKVVKIMTVDTKIAFSINSYADSRGRLAYNDELAFKRSQSIARYLMLNDISGSRLILDSYGEQGLLNDCNDDSSCDEIYHAVNRRSELELVLRKLHR